MMSGVAESKKEATCNEKAAVKADADPATVAEYIFAPDGPIAIVGEPGATHPRYVNALDRRTGLPFTTKGQAEEAVGRR